MAPVEDDHRLSCAAVGLWYRICSAERAGPVSDAEVLTCAANPKAWHPDGSVEDLERPLDELRAIGWVVEDGDGYHAIAGPE